MTWTYRRLCLALAGVCAVAGAIVARPPSGWRERSRGAGHGDVFSHSVVDRVCDVFRVFRGFRAASRPSAMST
jgi:hypothetical protein